jgi:hypothetical protein
MTQAKISNDKLPIYEFFVIDPTGDEEFKSDKLAEKEADEWLKNNGVVLDLLTSSKIERLANGATRRFYRIYGEYTH